MNSYREPSQNEETDSDGRYMGHIIARGSCL